MLSSVLWHVLFLVSSLAPEIKQKSPSSSMGEDSFGLLTNDADDASEAKNAAEAVNPGVVLKSTSASEVISRSNESLDDLIGGGGGGMKSGNRTSFKAARQHVKVQEIDA